MGIFPRIRSRRSRSRLNTLPGIVAECLEERVCLDITLTSAAATMNAASVFEFTQTVGGALNPFDGYGYGQPGPQRGGFSRVGDGVKSWIWITGPNACNTVDNGDDAGKVTVAGRYFPKGPHVVWMDVTVTVSANGANTGGSWTFAPEAEVTSITVEEAPEGDPDDEGPVQPDNDVAGNLSAGTTATGWQTATWKFHVELVVERTGGLADEIPIATWTPSVGLSVPGDVKVSAIIDVQTIPALTEELQNQVSENTEPDTEEMVVLVDQIPSDGDEPLSAENTEEDEISTAMPETGDVDSEVSSNEEVDPATVETVLIDILEALV